METRRASSALLKGDLFQSCSPIRTVHSCDHYLILSENSGISSQGIRKNKSSHRGFLLPRPEDNDMCCRQGITPEDHARKNAAAVKAASERNRALKEARLREEKAHSSRRRASARMPVSSSGYGTPEYTPR